MADESKIKKELKVVDTLKLGRTVYTIVAEFKDGRSQFFVGKYNASWGGTSYSNIIHWDSQDKRWYLRR